MADRLRTWDIGTVVSSDSAGADQMVFARFDAVNYDANWPSHGVPIKAALLEAAGIAVSVGVEFWAEINDFATRPEDVKPMNFQEL